MIKRPDSTAVRSASTAIVFGTLEELRARPVRRLALHRVERSLRRRR